MVKTKRILLVVAADAFARQMGRWALALQRDGRWEPVIYIPADYMRRHFDECRAAGIEVLPTPASSPSATASEASEPPDLPTAPPRAVKFLRTLRERGGASLPRQFWIQLKLISATISRFRELLAEHRIEGILLSESWPAHYAPAYIRAARMLGIPVVTQPIEKSSPSMFADAYLYDPAREVSGFFSRLVAAIFPRWVRSHSGRRLLHMPAAVVLAMEWLRIAPANPWLLIGDQEDICAVSGDELVDHYLSEGVPREKLVAVGTAEHDVLFGVGLTSTERKQALARRLGLPPDRPMILSPLPPDHYMSGRPECDFQNYEDMLQFWIKALDGVKSHNSILSLHPGHTYGREPGTWAFLERPGVKIALDDIATLIPLCDIYVCCAFTSTAQWAIAAGKPVINYDVYRFGYPTYRDAPGVLEMQDQEAFLRELNRLSSDHAYYETIAAKQRASAARWGILDGNATNRMVGLFESLAAVRRSQA